MDTEPGGVPGDSAAEDEAAAGVAERTAEGTRQRLASLADLPTADHVAVFDALHRDLSGVLAALDREETSAERGSG
ncbi:MAG: hypothetical protein M0026_05670 [Nocardiopsaceae bacterium]|nr:hypothetical protein [Nocardiopsaceae bacterium]